MIYDKIENLKMYEKVIPHFDILQNEVNKILKTSFSTGEKKTSNDDIFYIASEYTTENKLFEAHKDYFDVQIVIEGKEIALIGEAKKPFSYDESGNISNVECTETCSIKLIPNHFAIFVPDEMHSPGLPDEVCSTVKKIVFKIKKN